MPCEGDWNFLEITRDSYPEQYDFEILIDLKQYILQYCTSNATFTLTFTSNFPFHNRNFHNRNTVVSFFYKRTIIFAESCIKIAWNSLKWWQNRTFAYRKIAFRQKISRSLKLFFLSWFTRDATYLFTNFHIKLKLHKDN